MADEKNETTTTSEVVPYSGEYHREIIYMLAASGLSIPEIAKSANVPEKDVKVAMRHDLAGPRIRELQGKIFGSDLSRRFKSIAHKAVDTLEDIMGDNKVKASTRLSAASEVLDRAIGKPKQFIEHTDGNIRELYEKMDQMMQSRGKGSPITVEAVRVESPTNLQDTVHNQIVAEEGISNDVKEEDEIDQWLDRRKSKTPQST